ncbi:DUF6286 domain-containing protein [Kitasatospora sp. NPDC056181]|uniref:DUF6286 domain-containing protein n=1 Tax=Kitasatospora sp. NPDC056181 TaxID=3345737 RepID=UPI0035E1FCA5
MTERPPEAPPEAPPVEPTAEPPQPEAVSVPRLRAPRTFAAVVVATVVLVFGVALLYDVIAVRTGHSARRWRAEIADELATRHLDDPWVLLGAGVAALLGAWLLWLAFAPGLRRWLSMRPHGDTAAAIDRAGVGTLLLDRAAGLPGVEHLTLRINRRRVKVLLRGPADPASVQRQLREELARVTLARPLRLDVQTRRGRARRGGSDADVDADTGAAADTGVGAGAEAGAGTGGPAGAGPGAGTGPAVGTGSGAESGTGSGAGTGAQAGTAAGAEDGAQDGAADGAQDGAADGTQNGGQDGGQNGTRGAGASGAGGAG